MAHRHRLLYGSARCVVSIPTSASCRKMHQESQPFSRYTLYLCLYLLVDAGIQLTCLPPCHLQTQRSHTAVLRRSAQLRSTAPVLQLLEDHKTDKLRLRYHTLPSLRHSEGMLLPYCRRAATQAWWRTLGKAACPQIAGKLYIRATLYARVVHITTWTAHVRSCVRCLGDCYAKSMQGRLWHG